jgi:hypothetical protein
VFDNRFLVKAIPTVMVPVVADFTNKYLITAALNKRVSVRALFKSFFADIAFSLCKFIHTSSFCVGSGSSALQRRTATNTNPADLVRGSSVNQRDLERGLRWLLALKVRTLSATETLLIKLYPGSLTLSKPETKERY